MLLKGPDGVDFELKILRYSHPGEKWLDIYTRVKMPRGSWECTDPSLQDRDIRSLSKWLIAHSKGRTKRREEDFEEPNLSFEMTHDSEEQVTLRVYFELESRPPWAPSGAAGERDVWVELKLTADDLRAAAESLSSELQKVQGQRGTTEYY